MRAGLIATSTCIDARGGGVDAWYAYVTHRRTPGKAPGTDGNPPFPWGQSQMPLIPAQYAGLLQRTAGQICSTSPIRRIQDFRQGAGTNLLRFFDNQGWRRIDTRIVRGRHPSRRSVCVPGEVGYPYAIVISPSFIFWVIREGRVTL